MSKLIQDIAYSLGCEAFKKGKVRIPAYDDVLLKTCIAGCKNGESLPYLKAWLKGWDFENLRKECKICSQQQEAFILMEQKANQ